MKVAAAADDQYMLKHAHALHPTVYYHSNLRLDMLLELEVSRYLYRPGSR